jgi:hypothetical protein
MQRPTRRVTRDGNGAKVGRVSINEFGKDFPAIVVPATHHRDFEIIALIST